MTRERPILFSAPMVRAILDGRKTQTRRIVAEVPRGQLISLASRSCHRRVSNGRDDERGWKAMPSFSGVRCAYGEPGDRLWVRETWRTMEDPDTLVDGIRFLADGAFVPIANTTEAADAWMAAHRNGKHGVSFRPSIHMPRWASRITLEVTGVRVERLQSISEEDARAEGLSVISSESWTAYDPDTESYPSFFVRPDETDGIDPTSVRHHVRKTSAVEQYRVLWNGLNAERAPWSSNPFVWVVSFKRVQS
jgi:hypothetical protein